MAERISMDEYKALIGKTNANARKGNKRSAEKELLGRWLLNCGPKWELEYKFHPKRRWKFDYAIPSIRLAVEYEGGAFVANGGHTGGKDYSDDCEKYSEAAILGWRVIRVTAPMIRSGLAIELIEKGLGVKCPPCRSDRITRQ